MINIQGFLCFKKKTDRTFSFLSGQLTPQKNVFPVAALLARMHMFGFHINQPKRKLDEQTDGWRERKRAMQEEGYRKERGRDEKREGWMRWKDTLAHSHIWNAWRQASDPWANLVMLCCVAQIQLSMLTSKPKTQNPSPHTDKYILHHLPPHHQKHSHYPPKAPSTTDFTQAFNYPPIHPSRSIHTHTLRLKTHSHFYAGIYIWSTLNHP